MRDGENLAAPRGVRVKTVSPGWIMTDGTDVSLTCIQVAKSGALEDARQFVLEGLGGVVIGRGDESYEVAEAIALLASDRASSIHGSEQPRRRRDLADHMIKGQSALGPTRQPQAGVKRPRDFNVEFPAKG